MIQEAVTSIRVWTWTIVLLKMFVLHWPLCSVSVLLLVFATFTLSFLVACLWFLPNFEWGPLFPMWQVVLWVGAPTIGQELAVMVNFVCQLD